MAMLDRDPRLRTCWTAAAAALPRLAGAAAVTLALLASAPARPDPSRRPRLARAIDAIVSRPELAAASWGIEVRSLSTGRTLYARNAEKAFRPASNMKLVTTAAALDAYGADARLRTTVETAGRLDGLGRILGDVYLVGRGDPDLSARFAPGHPTAALEQMADALVAAGVRRIEGRLVGHEGAFSGERRGPDWAWDDFAWGYGAEVSALSFADNQVEVELTPGERVGDPAVLDVSPSFGCVTVSSSVTTSEAGPARAVPDDEETVSLSREPGSSEVRLSGHVPLGGRWTGELSVSDPARCAARVFADVLEAKGVRVAGGLATSSDPLPSGSRVLALHESPTMAEIVRVVNKESQNLHAETLLRLVGTKAKGEGSLAAGREAVAAFVRGLGVPDAGWGLADGSGMSGFDLLTPRGLVALLAAMDRHPLAGAFRDSLPIAGVDGTLENRMKGTPAEGRLVAKTGSLRLARALAGYVTTTRGERLAFAIVVNNHEGRGREATAAIDDIGVALATAR
jgi:D-alanyl-D-alanine carboxypeptidase/D-alanyl-D-alanine-endopeptidase (penicillin-binding protein 4)